MTGPPSIHLTNEPASSVAELSASSVGGFERSLEQDPYRLALKSSKSIYGGYVSSCYQLPEREGTAHGVPPMGRPLVLVGR
jgi:hypothetical protein